MTKAQNLRLELLAALLDSEWQINYNTYLGFFQASLHRVHVCVGEHGLKGEWGRGSSAEAAVRDYLEELSGQTIVLYPASGQDRREIPLPADMVLAVFGD